MLAYILRRLLLIIPTLFGILIINFIIVQAAPGGPVEQMIAKLEGFEGATSRIAGGGAEVSVAGSNYRGAQGLDPALIAEIEHMYGFDKSAPERLWIMIKNYATLDFGDSFFRDAKVIDLIAEKMPVSISLGLWSTLIMYLVSIPLGIAKAVRHGSHFDVWTSSAIIVGYAIPAFLFAILLIVLFAGGSYFDWFPLRGLTSNNFDELSTTGKVLDYFWHLVLPITALVIGNFATMTLLTKNSFLDEINKVMAVRGHRQGQGPEPATRAVRACVPQRHAAGDRRLPIGIHWHLLHWLSADRGDLQPRWPGPDEFRSGDQPRLPGGLRHPVHLHPARVGGETDRRPDLYPGRSTHRLCQPGALTWPCPPSTAGASSASRPTAEAGGRCGFS